MPIFHTVARVNAVWDEAATSARGHSRSSLGRFVGQYRSDFGELLIARVNRSLYLIDPDDDRPMRVAARLAPVSDSARFVVCDNEDYGLRGEEVSFDLGAGGRAQLPSLRGARAAPGRALTLLLKPAVAILQLSVAQADNAVAALDKVVIVSRKDDGGAARSRGPEQIEDEVPVGRVELGGWLVGDDQPWLGHNRPTHGRSLLLAAGKLGGELAGSVVHSELGERLLDSCRHLIADRPSNCSGSATFSSTVNAAARPKVCGTKPRNVLDPFPKPGGSPPSTSTSPSVGRMIPART